ncbi:MAG: thioredoxin [Deltaproteobacteria bacterium]|nr:thioredoxin [Deltaproteobacteria bacterium]
MAGNVIDVTDQTFEDEILKSDLPVLVDFWATWCGPCKAIAPIVEDMAAAYAGRLKVAKVNVDNSPAAPSRYGVRGIPTLVLFKGGQVIDHVVGAVPKTQIEKLISKAL